MFCLFTAEENSDSETDSEDEEKNKENGPLPVGYVLYPSYVLCSLFRQTYGTDTIRFIRVRVSLGLGLGLSTLAVQNLSAGRFSENFYRLNIMHACQCCSVAHCPGPQVTWEMKVEVEHILCQHELSIVRCARSRGVYQRANVTWELNFDVADILSQRELSIVRRSHHVGYAIFVCNI